MKHIPPIHEFQLSSVSFIKNNTAFFPFMKNGLPYAQDDIQCILTLKDALSMRFRNTEYNPNRNVVFQAAGIDPSKVCTAELCHSHTVYAVSMPHETAGRRGDGIITVNKDIVPAVTVADCVPIYLFDPVTRFFGVVHSGWKGTGIASDAVKKAAELWNAKSENVLAVIGPHIRSCCYTVDEERANFFSQTISPECCTASEIDGQFRLSLAKANTAVLTDIGIPPENIAHISDCTSCSPYLGSFRRETRNLPSGISPSEKINGKHFTPMAACVIHRS